MRWGLGIREKNLREKQFSGELLLYSNYITKKMKYSSFLFE
jgi:hypothetical protein